jgi:LuxR family transcriptional regulator, maltose regulon positive regulatory protein
LSRRLVDLGEPLVDSAAGPIPARIWFSAYVGWYLYMNCADALAQSWLRRGTEIALSNNLPHLASLPQSFLSHAAIVTRDFPLAEQQFEQINSTLATGRVLDAAQLQLAQAMFHCGKGNAQLAMQAGRLAVDSAIASGSPSVITIWHGIVAGVMAEFGRFEAAEQLLASARQASEGTAVRAYDAFMLMLDAYLSLVWRHDGRERELLRKSLSLARDRTTHGSYRWFLGSIGSVMFDHAIAHDIEADYALSMAKLLRLRPTATSCAAWPWPIRIHTLGRFVVEVGGAPLRFSHKTPRKPLALLKLLVASGGSEVPAQRLVDALWSEEPGDAGQDALTVAVYRLRKVLGDPEAVQVHDGRVLLDRSRCWADAWALAKLTEPGPVPPTPDDVERVLALYQGPFLPGDETEAWALSAHERLRARILAFLSTAGRTLEAGGHLDQALACYRRGQSVDDLAEEMYVGEMRCLRALGRRAEAMASYRRLRQLLSITLGVQPSAASDALFRSLAED